MITSLDITHQRLYNQHLAGTPFEKPEAVVAWLGAVQAQEYAHAKWALGLRMQDAADNAIEQAFTNGAILRTHLMRPTWHFVTPADIRWMLKLTAPRVNAVNAHMYRKLELDDALFLRSNAAIAKALEGGQQLTRLELASVLEQAGIVAEGIRLGYIVHRAELDAIICSGSRRGKQFTYALLDERAPRAKALERDEAVAELTKRYFTSHGPALVRDFVWWSGLTTADAKAGLEMTKPHLIHEMIDGKIYWFSPNGPTPEEVSPTAHLLPIYDEYTIAYKDHSAIFDPQYAKQVISGNGFVIVIDGQVVGNWRRTFSKGAAVIELAPFRPFTATECDAFTAATRRYGEFLSMPVVLS
jgi:hypothetical protein